MNKLFAGSVLALSLALNAATANAQTTLRLAHLWPEGSAVNQQIFKPWAEAVEQASGGEIRVQIYPSQTLVKANSAYDAAVQGIADISVTLQGYSAGRFPLSEIVQLPGVSGSANQGACILQSLLDDGSIAQDYSDTQPLFLFTTGPAYLHTRERVVLQPDDLQGLRMRRPSEVAGQMLASMGAQPVGMPAPDIYAALQRGVVDGLSFPWEAMKVFRTNDLTQYHLEIPYYSGALMAVMNKSVYQRLPAELKAVIDAHSGMHWAQTSGTVFADLDRQGRAEALAQGDRIETIPDPLNDERWAQPLREGTEAYLQRVEQKGYTQAREIYRKALAYRDGACAL